jgi:Fe-S cluster biogenesis protein NfuA
LIVRVCRDVLAPMIKADGGELYLIARSSEEIQIHLAGTCSGCPGAQFTQDRVLGPALAAVAPKARLVVTTGWRVPEGAEKID